MVTSRATTHCISGMSKAKSEKPLIISFSYSYQNPMGGKISVPPKSLQMVIAAMKLKDAYPLEEKL